MVVVCYRYTREKKSKEFSLKQKIHIRTTTFNYGISPFQELAYAIVDTL